MSAAVSGVPAEAAVARVLAEHGYEWSDGLEMLLCDCGWAMDAYIDYEDGLAERDGEKAGHDGREIAVVIRHRAHVAEVVTAALREQIAAEVLGPVRALVTLAEQVEAGLQTAGDGIYRIEVGRQFIGTERCGVVTRDRLRAALSAPVQAAEEVDGE